jgi:o-succinylbenzoate synthase
VIDVEPFSVRLQTPLESARGRITERSGFLITVEHAGATGVGEATPLAGWTESYGECREALERARQVAAELDWGVALSKLDAPAARHGLSLALAEARARSEGEPLYRSLGGDRTVSRLPVNATLGTRADDPEAVAGVAEAAVDAGYGCLKLKVGSLDVEEDVERVRAVRNAVGDRVTLRVDANGAWRPDQAGRALSALGELGVEYVEQPLPTAELSATARLRDSPVDIALDESLAAHDVEHVLGVDAADVLVLKPMVLGGPDRTVEAARRCREAGVDPVVSSTFDAVVARTAAVHAAATITDVRPCGLATGDRLATDLAPDPAPVSDGWVAVPQEPGLGFADRPP